MNKLLYYYEAETMSVNVEASVCMNEHIVERSACSFVRWGHIHMHFTSFDHLCVYCTPHRSKSLYSECDILF